MPSCVVDSFGGGDFSTKINGAVRALAADGGVIDARCLGGAQAANTPIDLDLLGKPISLILAPSLKLNCLDTGVRFGSHVEIIGSIGDGGGGGTRITTADGGKSLLVPSDPAANTGFVKVSGIDFWNSASAVIAPVVDLRNTSNSRFSDCYIEKSGGPASCVFARTTLGNTAYYNLMHNVRLHGGGDGIGYELDEGCNDFRVFGGTVSSMRTAIFVYGSPQIATTGVSFYDVSVEEYLSYGINISAHVHGFRWFGGRLESNVGQLVSIDAAATKITFFGPHIAGTQQLGSVDRAAWIPPI